MADNYDSDWYCLEKLSPKTRTKRQRDIRAHLRATGQSTSITSSRKTRAQKTCSTPILSYKLSGGVRKVLSKTGRLSSGGKHNTAVSKTTSSESENEIDLEIDESACNVTPPCEYQSPNGSFLSVDNRTVIEDSISAAADELIQEINNSVVPDIIRDPIVSSIPLIQDIGSDSSDTQGCIGDIDPILIHPQPLCHSTVKQADLLKMSAGNSSDVNQGNLGEKSKLMQVAELRTSELTDENRQQQQPPITPSKQSDTAHLHTMSFTPHDQVLIAHRIAVEIAADWMSEEGQQEYWMNTKSLSVLEEVYKDCSEQHKRVRNAWGYYKVNAIDEDVTKLKTELFSTKSLLNTLIKELASKSTCPEVTPPNNQVNPNQTYIAKGNPNSDNIVTPSVTGMQPTVAQTTTVTTATPTVFKTPPAVSTVGVHVGQINSATVFATAPATNAAVLHTGMQHSAAGTYSSATAPPGHATEDTESVPPTRTPSRSGTRSPAMGGEGPLRAAGTSAATAASRHPAVSSVTASRRLRRAPVTTMSAPPTRGIAMASSGDDSIMSHLR